MSKIKVALVGVGNCASALVQGVYYYRDFSSPEETVGIKNLLLGGYHPKDIEFVSAFDVDSRKVGRDLSEAIFSQPNNTLKFGSVPKTEIIVEKGPILDGLGEALKRIIKTDDSPPSDVSTVLSESGAEIVVNLLPSGAVKASKWYAEEALKAGCAYVNATPVEIAGDPSLSRRFEEEKIPVVGDDLINQVGSTAIHKAMLRILATNGVRITKTYQLDVGGGTESVDTIDRSRKIKRTFKTKSVSEALPYEADVVAGSTDFVDFLENRRDSYFWIEGVYFGNAPLRIDIRISSVDAPNGGSVLLDVIRAVKIAIDRGVGGVIPSISAYAFKKPSTHLEIGEAERKFMEFIEGK